MSTFDAIAADLLRQRRDLDESLENTSVRCERAADLLKKIDELRSRVEATQQKYAPPPKRSAS